MPAQITTYPRVGQNRAEFNAAAYSFVAQMAAFTGDYNAQALVLDSAVATVNAGMSAPVWSSGMATTQFVTRAFSRANGRLYLRIGASGTSTTDPASDEPNWRLLTLPNWPMRTVSATTYTAIANVERYAMLSDGAASLTLPSNPALGDAVPVMFFNARADNFVRRGNQLLMGLSEDVQIDRPFFSGTFVFVGGVLGWGVGL